MSALSASPCTFQSQVIRQSAFT